MHGKSSFSDDLSCLTRGTKPRERTNERAAVAAVDEGQLHARHTNNCLCCHTHTQHNTPTDMGTRRSGSGGSRRENAELDQTLDQAAAARLRDGDGCGCCGGVIQSSVEFMLACGNGGRRSKRRPTWHGWYYQPKADIFVAFLFALKAEAAAVATARDKATTFFMPQKHKKSL